MKFQPLQDRIVIEQKEADEMTEGGIVIPNQAQEKPLEGKVVATGPGRVLDNGEKIVPSVKEGDTVLFPKFSGTEVEVEKKTYLVVREPDILGILHKDA
jgi:chaperonin GroES